MLRSSLLTCTFFVGTCAVAQYEVGASVGVYRYSLDGRKSDGHEYASFSHVPATAFTASLSYRERCASHTDLGVELQFTRKSFDARYSDGGIAGSDGTDAHVDLDLLHLNVALEVRLNSKGTAVVRFGPQVGFRVGGRMTGYHWSIYPYPNPSYRSWFVGATPSDFGGDLRFLFGLGFRSGTGPWGVTFDPYCSTGVGILLKSPGAKGTEFGVKIGCSLRREKTTLTQWVNRFTSAKPANTR